MTPYLYEAKNSVVHRLDPRAKIFILVAWFVIALVPSTLPHAFAALALVLVYVTLAKSWGAVARIRAFLVIITVFTILVWGIVPREGEAILFFVKRESLVFGILTAIKIDAILMAGIVFLATTRNEEIMIGLVKLGAPYVMCFAFSTALRLVPTFAATGATVVEAQRSRGLELDSGSLWSRMKAYIPLMAPIFLVSIRNANLMAMALEARGFGVGKNRTFFIQLKMRARDGIALGLAVAATVASVYFALWG
jgi:energy-coupling factor transport system permease protein